MRCLSEMFWSEQVLSIIIDSSNHLTCLTRSTFIMTSDDLPILNSTNCSIIDSQRYMGVKGFMPNNCKIGRLWFIFSHMSEKMGLLWVSVLGWYPMECGLKEVKTFEIWEKKGESGKKHFFKVNERNELTWFWSI